TQHSRHCQAQRRQRVQAHAMGACSALGADPSIGNRTINARAETLTALRSVKSLVNGGRCIIAADGFYEYQEANEKVQALEQQLSDFKAQLAVAAKKPALEQNMAQLQEQLETIKKERDAAIRKQQAADDKLQNIERKRDKP